MKKMISFSRSNGLARNFIECGVGHYRRNRLFQERARCRRFVRDLAEKIFFFTLNILGFFMILAIIYFVAILNPESL